MYDIHLYYICSSTHVIHVYDIHYIYKYMLHTLREESSHTNVILKYKLLAANLSAVCSVIQQSYYVLHFYYTLYDGKYDCKINTHYTIFQLQCVVLLNNHQYKCNITKSFLSVYENYRHVHIFYRCMHYMCNTHTTPHM